VSSTASIPVVILCGGKGTRLGQISRVMPKPLVSVGGMPILWHIMKLYAHHGYKDFVLCLGYKGQLIEEYFTHGTIAGEPAGSERPREPDWKITFADTGPETGTSGRVFRIKPHVEKSERFFLTYGDGVTSVSIPDLLRFHRSRGKLATVTGVRPPTSFGIIQEQDGIVTGFKEKPRLDVLINGGFFVLEKRALDYVEEDGPFEVRPLNRLTAERELAVFVHEGFWRCMDNQKEMEELNAMWGRGERPWAAWEERRAGDAGHDGHGSAAGDGAAAIAAPARPRRKELKKQRRTS
jgi:glucose-1-phosphate cytidylyltransferase